MSLYMIAAILLCVAGCAGGGGNLSPGVWHGYQGVALAAGREFVLGKVADYGHVIEIIDHKAGVASLKTTRGEGDQPDQMDTFMFVGGELFSYTSYHETTRATVNEAFASLAADYGEGQPGFPEGIEQYSIYAEMERYIDSGQLEIVSWFDAESQRLMVAMTTKPQPAEEPVADLVAEEPADVQAEDGAIGDDAAAGSAEVEDSEEAPAVEAEGMAAEGDAAVGGVAEDGPATAEPVPDESAILLVYLFDLPLMEENYEAFSMLQ